jgi:hypothetical protein
MPTNSRESTNKTRRCPRSRNRSHRGCACSDHRCGSRSSAMMKRGVRGQVQGGSCRCGLHLLDRQRFMAWHRWLGSSTQGKSLSIRLALHFAKHSNRISAPVPSEDGGSNGLYATAGSESESHNEDCIVPLPCPKRLLVNYTKANPGIEVYCVLIGLFDFEK